MYVLKRLTIVLILALAMALPLLAGCGENVKVVLPALSDSQAAQVQDLVASGHLYLTLKNVHVHTSDGTDVPMVAQTRINLINWLQGDEYVVCAANLAPGSYYDLAFNLYQADYDYSIQGTWGVISLTCSGDGTVPFNGGNGYNVHMDPDHDATLTVYEGGTAEWAWNFNMLIMLDVDGCTSTTDFGVVVTVPVNG